MARRIWRTALGQAFILVLVSGCLAAIVNVARSKPVPWDSKPAYEILPHIDLAEAVTDLEAGDCLFLDARPTSFFQLGHILNAIAMPLETTDAEVRKQLPPPHPYRRVIIYCEDENCDAGDSMARRLKRLGYDKLFVLEGGWRAWMQADLPKE